MRFAAYLLALTALSIGACGDTEREPDDDAGGETTSGASGSGNGGGASAGGAGSGGAQTTCDDLGFCGQAEDPGCVSCSVTTGSCVDELDACDSECNALRACYSDCDVEDPSCFAQCDELHPAGVDKVNALYSCILCIECPSSCAFDTANCR